VFAGNCRKGNFVFCGEGDCREWDCEGRELRGQGIVEKGIAFSVGKGDCGSLFCSNVTELTGDSVNVRN